MKKSNVFLAMLLTGGLAVAVTAADPFEEKKVYLNSQAGKKAESTGEKVTKGTVHVSTSLNIRTGPWGKIIGSFREGDALEVLGREGAWYKIRYNGKIAYVHANYVSTPGNPAGKTPVIYPWQ